MNLSLRISFVISLTITIFLAVALTGWLSLRGSQSAVQEIAEDLCQEMAMRIREQVLNFLEAPAQLNRLNVLALKSNRLDLQEPLDRQQYFFHQIQAFPTIAYIYLGLPSGDFYGVRRRNNDGLSMAQNNKPDENNTVLSATTSEELIQTFIEPYPDFDPRTRPWYKKAASEKKLVWSELYLDFLAKQPTITASHPVYSEQGQLVGVFGVDFIMTQFNELLHSLAKHPGHPGKVLIMERGSALIATSMDTPVLIEQNNQQMRVSALNHSDPVLRAAAQHLHKIHQEDNVIKGTHVDFKIEVNKQRQFVYVLPITNKHELDWLVMIIIPELAFMGDVRRLFWLTIAATMLLG
ncbi:MAG: cache domain-containing protein, partial [Pseudomonadota bacterium]